MKIFASSKDRNFYVGFALLVVLLILGLRYMPKPAPLPPKVCTFYDKVISKEVIKVSAWDGTTYKVKYESGTEEVHGTNSTAYVGEEKCRRWSR